MRCYTNTWSAYIHSILDGPPPRDVPYYAEPQRIPPPHDPPPAPLPPYAAYVRESNLAHAKRVREGA